MSLPIRRRLALVCGTLVGAIVLGLGGLIFLRLEADLRTAADDSLDARLEALMDEPPAGSTIDIGPSDAGDVFAQVLSRDADLIATSPGLTEPVLGAPGLAAMRASTTFEGVAPIQDEQLLVRLRAVERADGSVLVVGVAFDDQREALDRLLGLLVVATPLAALAAAFVGWLVAGAALRPVDRMRRESEAISGSEPGRRLDVPTSRDELTALGTSLNGMLDRLEEALLRERRFVDDASHELRTPLANLKAELDLALSRARTPDQLEAALRSASAETDRLALLADDLLLLARAEGGSLPFRRGDTDLAALVADVTARFALRAEARGISLTAESTGAAPVRVDEARLRQALGNLIENALLHTPEGGRVTVRAERAGDVISIRVADTGGGFPDEFLPRAFEPFSRVSSARGREDGGTGLGLAIVRAVAEGHGGSVRASNGAAGGATVEIRLPA